MTSGIHAEPTTHPVTIHVGVMLSGDLTIPAAPRGIVLFAHGSGSSRFSPRNQRVAARLHHAGFATLLFDLLTTQEDAVDMYTTRLRFDIPMLANRLVRVTDWVDRQAVATNGLPIGYFGASTGAAAALIAATERPELVHAIVSRGGRPDLAGGALRRVTAPTLLIVGGEDAPVIEMNRLAYADLRAPMKRLELVPGATHLFEERGALERVADLASDWFDRHLAVQQPHRVGQ
jgi:pimeloyl-ACP methyl ester carboxylesterase